MSRGAHDATVRTLDRFVGVIHAQLADLIAAQAPEGLDVPVPEIGDFFALPNADAVRRFRAARPVQIFVFPSSERPNEDMTGSATERPSIARLNVSVAVHVLDQGGAEAVDGFGGILPSSSKTLTVEEREFRRCEVLTGAIRHAIDKGVMHRDTVVRADLLRQRTGEDRFRDSSEPAEALGAWGIVEYQVTQIVTVPQQTRDVLAPDFEGMPTSAVKIAWWFPEAPASFNFFNGAGDEDWLVFDSGPLDGATWPMEPGEYEFTNQPYDEQPAAVWLARGPVVDNDKNTYVVVSGRVVIEKLDTTEFQATFYDLIAREVVSLMDSTFQPNGRVWRVAEFSTGLVPVTVFEDEP